MTIRFNSRGSVQIEGNGIFYIKSNLTFPASQLIAPLRSQQFNTYISIMSTDTRFVKIWREKKKKSHTTLNCKVIFTHSFIETTLASVHKLPSHCAGKQLCSSNASHTYLFTCLHHTSTYPRCVDNLCVNANLYFLFIKRGEKTKIRRNAYYRTSSSINFNIG